MADEHIYSHRNCTEFDDYISLNPLNKWHKMGTYDVGWCL